jgi:NAD(P) transhydrogenase subunit beta
MTTAYLIEFSYLAASLLFIYGLRSLTHPDSARRGMQAAEVGMLLAVIGTLMHREIVSYPWIIAGLLLGGSIGGVLAHKVPMTALPQLTAISHAFGAFAAAIVGVVEYHKHAAISTFTMTALAFEVLLGALTTTGSVIAWAKLQDLLPGAPMTFKGQRFFNFSLIALLLLLFLTIILHPAYAWAFYLMLIFSFVFGVMLVLPIGTADMPVVMALLNSYAGLAASAMGFAIGNNVLIIAGTLNGFSGFILSMAMCKAMNRSITNVLFGAFGSTSNGNSQAAGGVMREVDLENTATQLAYARQVVFVPGYGMATAQAQHVVRELADTLEDRGVTVKFAVHPVAGRMPGHMNVLLAEANVPYSQLYELEQINPDMPNTDVSVVIGANDVVNPDARDNPQSPIAGMPIIEVDKSKQVIVLKRGKGKGFSGIENPLFFKPNTGMLYGDAKESLARLAGAVRDA